MDILTLENLQTFATTAGPFGLLLFMWWHDMNKIRNIIEDGKKAETRWIADTVETAHRHQDEMRSILTQHKAWMDELRGMYEKNVRLVEDYQRLATDLRDVVLMNTSTSQRLIDAIEKNQFCPILRVEKDKIYVARDQRING
jgi:hypothetical protein